MGFIAKGRIGKSTHGGKKKSAKARMMEQLGEVLSDYHTKVGLSPEQAAAYGDYNISSGMSNLHLDAGDKEGSGNVTCDRCSQKFPSTLVSWKMAPVSCFSELTNRLQEGREDLTRHGLIGHDLKHICTLLKIEMPDFKAQMEVFTQDQMDVYVIALISTYSKSRPSLYPW